MLLTRTFELSREDTVVYFSPYIFPIYSYSTQSSDLRDESEVGMSLFKFLCAGLGWGISMAMFTQPVEFGVAITCGFLLTIAVVTATCIQIVPLQIGESARFVTDQMILEAASMARQTSVKRREEFTLVNEEWEDVDEAANDMWERELGASAVKGIHKSEVKHGWEAALTTARRLVEKKEGLRFRRARNGKLIPRSDGLITFEDAIARCVIAGHGPFGFISMSGSTFRGYMWLLKLIQKRWLKDLPRERWCGMLGKYDEVCTHSSLLNVLSK